LIDRKGIRHVKNSCSDPQRFVFGIWRKLEYLWKSRQKQKPKVVAAAAAAAAAIVLYSGIT